MQININDRLARFKGDPCYTEKNLDVLVIGLGAIGSRLIRELINIGNFNYYLSEDANHIVAIENIGVQWYHRDSIGYSKWTSLVSQIKAYGSANNINHIPLYDAKSIECPIVFIGTDNITSRYIAFEKWVGLVNSLPDVSNNSLIPSKSDCIFIDGRLRLWTGEMYTVSPCYPSSIDRYRKTLFPEESVQDAACTVKMTSPSATKMGAEMAGQFCNYIAKINTGDEDLDLPFSIKFNIRRNYHEITL